MRSATARASAPSTTTSEMTLQAHDAVLVLGAHGMVGAALTRALAARGFSDVRTPPRAELELGDAGAVDAYFARTRPAYVFVAAARVGGILANDSRPVDFLEDNLLIAVHVIPRPHANLEDVLPIGKANAKG